MKNYFISLFLCFCACVINPVLAGEPVMAPDFQLQDVHQDMITLSAYRDKQPVVLYFWATWAPACQDELRVLNNSYAGFVKDGIEVLAIDVGEMPDTVNDFIQSYNLAYEVLLDKDSSVAGSFRTEVPAYVLVNKKGEVVYKDDFFPYSKYKDLLSG